jgi:isopenicillin-N N-acyltransferase like protein
LFRKVNHPDLSSNHHKNTDNIMGSLGPVTAAPRCIELSGTPVEIGREHGRQLTKEIRGQIEVYEAMFKQTSKLDWAAVKEVSKEYAATVQRLTPDVYAEMLGIAEGASLDVLDIVALNSRSEIALGLFSDGCSSLGWKRDSEVLLAQNWDWTSRVKNNCCLMSIKQENKPAIWMVTEVSFCSSCYETLLIRGLGWYCRKDWL